MKIFYREVNYVHLALMQFSFEVVNYNMKTFLFLQGKSRAFCTVKALSFSLKEVGFHKVSLNSVC